MPTRRRAQKIKKIRQEGRENKKMDKLYEEARVLRCTVAGQALYLEEDPPALTTMTWKQWLWGWMGLTY